MLSFWVFSPVVWLLRPKGRLLSNRCLRFPSIKRVSSISYPTDLFTLLVPRKQWIAFSELHTNCRSTDFLALKLWEGPSGSPSCFLTSCHDGPLFLMAWSEPRWKQLQFYVVHKHRSTYFDAQMRWKGRSGCTAHDKYHARPNFLQFLGPQLCF